MTRLRVGFCVLLAALVGLLALATIEGFDKGDIEWTGTLMLLGATVMAIPVLIVAGIAMMFARQIAENPIPFCLFGPICVLVPIAMIEADLLMWGAIICGVAALVFYALARLIARMPEAD